MKSGLDSRLDRHRDGDVSLAVNRPDYHTDLAPLVHIVAVDVGGGFDKFCEIRIFVITLGNESKSDTAVFRVRVEHEFEIRTELAQFSTDGSVDALIGCFAELAAVLQFGGIDGTVLD